MIPIALIFLFQLAIFALAMYQTKESMGKFFYLTILGFLFSCCLAAVTFYTQYDELKDRELEVVQYKKDNALLNSKLDSVNAVNNSLLIKTIYLSLNIDSIKQSNLNFDSIKGQNKLLTQKNENILSLVNATTELAKTIEEGIISNLSLTTKVANNTKTMTITDDQKIMLKWMLKEEPGRVIICPLSDRDNAYIYSETLKGIFRAAGWYVSDPQTCIVGGLYSRKTFYIDCNRYDNVSKVQLLILKAITDAFDVAIIDYELSPDCIGKKEVGNISIYAVGRDETWKN